MIGNLQKAAERGDAFRIVPENWVPTSGIYVMCLGSDSPGFFGNFVGGDRIQVAQTGDFEDDTILRLTAHTRGPDAMPADTAWFAELAIDGELYAEREIRATREREVFDMGANVSRFAGDHSLEFRLSFRDLLATGNTFEVEIPAFYLDAITFEDI